MLCFGSTFNNYQQAPGSVLFGINDAQQELHVVSDTVTVNFDLLRILDGATQSSLFYRSS